MTQNGEQDVGPDDSKIKNDSKTNTFRRVVRAVLAILVVGGTIGIVGAIALGAGDGQDGIGDALKLFGGLGILSKVVIDSYFKQEE